MQLVTNISRCRTGGFRAWCPGLPGCVVWGSSRNEASDRIGRAVLGYIAHLTEVLPRELARLARLRAPGARVFPARPWTADRG